MVNREKDPPFRDLFSGHAAAYAAYRPSYPMALVEYLARLAPGRERAWDCGSGSGQLAVLLAERFAQVEATDASAAQIAHAAPHPRVTYRVAPAEASGLPGGTCDLVTAAQAAHWFELAAFYGEVRRVARPGAVVALIGYGLMFVDTAADAVIQRFYTTELAGFWPPERRHLEAGYRTLPFPFTEITPPAFTSQAQWSRHQLVAYVETWSSVAALAAAGEQARVARLREDLAAVWPDGETRSVRWPLCLRVGKV